MLPTDSTEQSMRLASADEQTRRSSRMATYLAALVGIEFVLGAAALFFVSPSRPSGWVPQHGRGIYLAHAIIGLPLGLGALAFLQRVRRGSRHERLSGWTGLVGVVIAAGGGLLAVNHSLRLVGMGLMLLGPVVAGFGYLIPTLELMPGNVEPGNVEPGNVEPAGTDFEPGGTPLEPDGTPLEPGGTPLEPGGTIPE